MKLFLILYLISLPAFASWLCKEAASSANGDIFYACGVAESSTLDGARTMALDNAKKEFNKFCKDKAYILTPMGTDCNKQLNKYICYRGVQYTITDNTSNKINVSQASSTSRRSGRCFYNIKIRGKI